MSTEPEIKAFCKNVKALRETFNLSKKSMSNILGIGISSLNKIESGVLPPRLNCDVLFRIYAIFKVPPSKLFYEETNDE